eukprot:TRINITY_DN3104_c0_g2_i1.p1 TRINITY_DN3104_c0_g2~~TRINITY_DN3104_c0_g2_i1.p1  ORF type:complete len:163 (-),score=46.91 TRINITY_DN3104_c0_g2_i1:309-797(-)
MSSISTTLPSSISQDTSLSSSSSSTGTPTTSGSPVVSSANANASAGQQKSESESLQLLQQPPQQQQDLSEFIKDGKVIVMAKNVGSAPPLKQMKFRLQVTFPFYKVHESFRRQLQLPPEAPLFLFINSTFQPSPDEIIENLFKCFHVNGKLEIQYCFTPAWG